ncbi:opacity protein-like surface antigen [Pontibacter aydingkolensis]|uniref:PorT family protein n=1 Tax=Pontibacter aydingkolensis TaxID=1911536 RepID=A0ABS7CW51_9BACT|nr:porin family protein [Pontibacter aydingkolensis]MBW7468054.1 PorT family protein [Pontibacter aydingkolensis]
MKKLLFLVAFALVSSTGFGQQLGVKAGATYATFKGDDAKNYDYRLGYTAGVMLQQHITDLVGVQVEALYTSKGAKIENKTGNTEINNIYRLNYVDVPVMLHLSAGGMFIDLGPQASFISSAKRISETTTNSTTTTVETDITDNPYTIDFSYVAGIGFRASNNIGIELRYNGGLKKIDDEGPLVGIQRRNSHFNLMLSYLFW